MYRCEVSYVPTKSPTVFLTDEEIQFFHDNGYLVVPQVTTKEEVQNYLIPIYDQMFAEKRGRNKGDHFDLTGTDEDEKSAATPQILWPSRYGIKLNETQYFANAFSISKQLLGDDAYFGGDHAILKPPRTNTVTPWHQDEAYWNPDKLYNSCAFWMPMQDVDDTNGCMHFIPKSHKIEVQNHHCFDNNNKVHGLEVDHMPPELLEKRVAVPLKAGGCTIHKSRTFHFTSGNTTDHPRRAYTLGFEVKPTETSGRDFYWNTNKQTAREERRKNAGNIGFNDPGN